MAFPDYPFDEYLSFESLPLPADWSMVDPDSNISLSVGAKMYGATGLRINDSGATAGKDGPVYILRDYGAGHITGSIGFWYRIPNIGAGNWISEEIGGFSFFDFALFGLLKIYIRMQGTIESLGIAIRGADFSDTIIGLIPENYYWITIDVKRNDTCRLSIYNEAHVQVGSEVSCIGSDSDWQYLMLGMTAGAPSYAESGLDWDYDDFVIDYTLADYPLLGWESAPSGLFVSRSTFKGIGRGLLRGVA